MADCPSTEATDDSSYPSSEQSDANQESAGYLALDEPQEENVQPCLDFDEDDLLPHEYARYHGLTKNFLLEPPMQCIEPLSHKYLQADLQDPDSTINLGHSVNFGTLAGSVTHERWDVDKESAECLASVLAVGKEHDLHAGSELDDAPRLKDLKLEDPVMASDPDADLQRLKRRNMIVISTDGLTPFDLNGQKGEGFSWTTDELRLPSDKDRSVAHERLDIDHETIELLKELSTAPCLNEKDFTRALSEGRKTAYPKPVTPPLMPLSPPIVLGGLSDAAVDFVLASTPEDLIAIEAANTERQILDRDNTPPDSTATKVEPRDPDTDTASVYTLLQSKTDFTSSPIPQKRLQDLKAEVPLVPNDGIERPAKKAKTVVFQEDLHSLIPPSETGVSVLDPEFVENDLHTFFTEVLEPFAESAMQQVKNETLVEIDTTMRVAVPQVEEIELVPPWKSVSQCGMEGSDRTVLYAMLSQKKREFSNSERKWGGVSKVELLLPWSPFPTRLGKLELNEVFDDGSSARYMADLSVTDHIDVDSLVFKPPWAERVYDSDDELLLEPLLFDNVEEVKPASSSAEPLLSLAPNRPTKAKALSIDKTTPVRLDMQTLLQKRKAELDAVNNANRVSTLFEHMAIRADIEAEDEAEDVSRPTKIDELTNDLGGLSTFVTLHAGPTRQNSLLQRSLQRPEQVAPPQMVMDALMGKETVAIGDARKSPLAPTIALAAKTAPIVVSLSLLASRELLQQVQIALPDIELIARDSNPSSAGVPSKDNNKNQEADITVSPSTGIVTTTLQKVKQKPLPGQPAFFGVHERIAFLSLRYTRLIVLVSEARQPGDDNRCLTAALDDRDTQALADLMGFGQTVPCDVVVYYITGGESYLAKWLAATVSQHAVPDGQVALLQDETFWERFLRSAGLNPFAAQIILDQLKLPEAIQEGESLSLSGASAIRPHGLAAFIQMSSAQRIESFCQTAGDKVLTRINEVFDRGWVSSASESARFRTIG